MNIAAVAEEQPEAVLPERTEAEIMAEKVLTVTMGEKPFKIPPRRGRKYTRPIRQAIGKSLEELKGAGNIIQKAISNQSEQLEEGDWDFVLGRLAQLLTDDLDHFIELAYDYAPEFEAEREYLEENAGDDQWVKALIVILGLLFGPFAQLAGIMGLQKVKASTVTETTPNPSNPSPNGSGK